MKQHYENYEPTLKTLRSKYEVKLFTHYQTQNCRTFFSEFYIDVEKRSKGILMRKTKILLQDFNFF